ncbi:MAG: type II secretion system protein GspC [Gammaproteobacteria bacterium]|nr:type II secretion system protein GspC [Gammaproteobacteria bacterium]
MNSRVNWTNIANVDSGVAVAAANRVLPPLVSLALVILIGWQLAGLVWLLVPGNSAGDPVAVPKSLPIAASAPGGASEIESIATAHMFGVAGEDPEANIPLEDADGDLADTSRVNLTLNGTVASREPEYSVALISDGGNDQKVYVIGDQVDSRASLHAVYPDRVVLNENGVLTNLRLPREFKDVPASTIRRTTAASRQPDNTQSIQAVVSQNLSKLSDVVRFTPMLDKGKPAGFRVYPGRDRQQFAALGLRPGDVIKDIDGQSLTDQQNAMQIFQALGTAEQVTVTVERGGKPQTIVLKTSQLDLSGNKTQ